MGLNSIWIKKLIEFLNIKNIAWEPYDSIVPAILINNTIILRLLNLKSAVTFEILELEKAKLTEHKFPVYNLWEDIWYTKQNQVISRLLYFSGQNSRIHARKCKVLPVKKAELIGFLEQNHLQGSVRIKYALGLFLEDKLIAVAGFNKLVMSSKGPGFISSELVRFCTLPGINIAGGLSKLIQHHKKEHHFNDLMTYADRDWSYGHGYQLLGFMPIKITPPIVFYIDPRSKDRLTEKQYHKFANSNLNAVTIPFYKVFNSGNIKFILNETPA